MVSGPASPVVSVCAVRCFAERLVAELVFHASGGPFGGFHSLSRGDLVIHTEDRQTAQDLALRGIEHQQDVIGDLRVRAAAVLSGGLVVATLFGPHAADAATGPGVLYGFAAAAFLAGAYLSYRVFARLPDGGKDGYNGDVENTSKGGKLDRTSARTTFRPGWRLSGLCHVNGGSR
jgi:hypothetical protein